MYTLIFLPFVLGAFLIYQGIDAIRTGKVLKLKNKGWFSTEKVTVTYNSNNDPLQFWFYTIINIIGGLLCFYFAIIYLSK